MTKVWHLDEIKKVLPEIDVVEAMGCAFEAYTENRAVVPPVGELLFSDPPGDAHIKYGYIKGDRWFVIKIASGFYDNPKKGFPANSGLMLIFDAQTGLPHAVLLEEGHLTNVRTAAAGALAAKLLAPDSVNRVGVIGSGVQARMQAEMLMPITPCRQLTVYARDREKARAYANDMSAKGFSVSIADTPAALAAECNLIVTTTAAKTPVLYDCDVRPGTHITAMGSDTPEKNELSPELLAKADLVVADSIAQCSERGEIHHALKANMLSVGSVIELGALLAGAQPGRVCDDDITICDLTGVAVQDIEICKSVMSRLSALTN